MTHRYVAIVIEFATDEALAAFQRQHIGGDHLTRIREYMDNASPDDVHVHARAYPMRPDYFSPYTNPMAVDVHLPTNTYWSDGTGGETMSVPCCHPGCDYAVRIRKDQYDELAGIVRCGRHGAH